MAQKADILFIANFAGKAAGAANIVLLQAVMEFLIDCMERFW